MKWIRKRPKYGDTVVRSHFAVFPTRLNSKTFIWLEWYKIRSADAWVEMERFQ